MSPEVYAEALRVESARIGTAHPLVTSKLTVYPTGRPWEVREIPALREIPQAAREPGAGFASMLLFWRANS